MTARGQTAAPTLDEVMQILRAHLPELRQTHSVKSLAVFGSYVKGRQHRRSDLDLLVQFDEGAHMTLFRFVALEEHLNEILGVKVDLVMKSALRPTIGKRILAEAVPV